MPSPRIDIPSAELLAEIKTTEGLIDSRLRNEVKLGGLRSDAMRVIRDQHAAMLARLATGGG